MLFWVVMGHSYLPFVLDYKLIDFYNDQKTGDVRYAMLYNELQQLKYEFEQFKQELFSSDETEENPRQKRKGFGKGE